MNAETGQLEAKSEDEIDELVQRNLREPCELLVNNKKVDSILARVLDFADITDYPAHRLSIH